MILIILCVISLIIVILLYRKGRKDAYVDPPDETTVKHLYDDEVFMENDIDEHSPENLEFNRVLRRVILQKKLQQIEEERKI